MVNKLLLVLIIILAIVLVIFVGRETLSKPTYHAVYLTTGDLYFGRLTRFPFGLRDVYLLQINQQSGQPPISIQKFVNVIWGPEDYVKINKDQVVWIAKVRADSELSKAIQSNALPSPAAGAVPLELPATTTRP